ncbi:MAG: MFS transporter [Pseudomonadota bacterium]
MDSRAALTFAGIAIGAFAVGTDFTGVMLLVPSIEADFDADITTTQWVLNIYALTFSMFMVAGGRLGDIRGHRRMMMVGFVIFIASSLGCFLAPGMGWLIAARAVQGVGAAMLWPCLIAKGSMVQKDDPGLGVGIVLAGVTTGNVVGPILSGLVVTLDDWRLFFLVSAIVGTVAMAISFFLLEREHPQDVQQKVDFGGIAVLSGAILALLVALDQGTDWGWQSPRILALFVACLALMAVFPFVEQRVKDPMIPLPLLGNRQFLLALSANGFCVPAIFIAFLYFPQYMTKVFGWTVLQASYGMTPLMVLLAVGSLISGRFYKKFGPRRLLLAGFALLCVGSVSVLFLKPAHGYLGLLPSILTIGLGATLCVGPAGTATVSAVSAARAGLAGGLSFMVHLVIGAIGVATATAVMYIYSLGRLGEGLKTAGIDLSEADRRAINGQAPDAEVVSGVVSKLASGQGDKLREVLTDSFAAGVSVSFWVAVIPAVIGLLAMLALDSEKLQGVDAAPAKT